MRCHTEDVIFNEILHFPVHRVSVNADENACAIDTTRFSINVLEIILLHHEQDFAVRWLERRMLSSCPSVAKGHGEEK